MSDFSINLRHQEGYRLPPVMFTLGQGEGVLSIRQQMEEDAGVAKLVSITTVVSSHTDKSGEQVEGKDASKNKD